MHLSDFETELISFQVDYPFAPLLWDRAGQVWQNLVAAFPKLQVSAAAPGSIAGQEERLELGVELKKAFLLLHRPEDVDGESVGRTCRQFFEAIAMTIETQQLDRIGCRIVFARPFPNAEEATGDLMKLGLLTLPTSAGFGLKDPKITQAEYVVVQRGLSTSVTIRIKSEERRVELKPPPSMPEVTSKQWKTARMVLDCDFFTIAPLLRSQFEASSWVTAANRVVRRDVKKFIGDQ